MNKNKLRKEIEAIHAVHGTSGTAVERILLLLDVVGRSEQLQGFFEFYKQKFGGGFNTDVLEITLKQYQETL